MTEPYRYPYKQQNEAVSIEDAVLKTRPVDNLYDSYRQTHPGYPGLMAAPIDKKDHPATSLTPLSTGD